MCIGIYSACIVAEARRCRKEVEDRWTRMVFQLWRDQAPVRMKRWHRRKIGFYKVFWKINFEECAYVCLDIRMYNKYMKNITFYIHLFPDYMHIPWQPRSLWFHRHQDKGISECHGDTMCVKPPQDMPLSLLSGAGPWKKNRHSELQMRAMEREPNPKRSTFKNTLKIVFIFEKFAYIQFNLIIIKPYPLQLIPIPPTHPTYLPIHPTHLASFIVLKFG